MVDKVKFVISFIPGFPHFQAGLLFSFFFAMALPCCEEPKLNPAAASPPPPLKLVVLLELLKLCRPLKLGALVNEPELRLDVRPKPPPTPPPPPPNPNAGAAALLLNAPKPALLLLIGAAPPPNAEPPPLIVLEDAPNDGVPPEILGLLGI